MHDKPSSKAELCKAHSSGCLGSGVQIVFNLHTSYLCLGSVLLLGNWGKMRCHAQNEAKHLQNMIGLWKLLSMKILGMVHPNQASSFWIDCQHQAQELSILSFRSQYPFLSIASTSTTTSTNQPVNKQNTLTTHTHTHQVNKLSKPINPIINQPTLTNRPPDVAWMPRTSVVAAPWRRPLPWAPMSGEWWRCGWGSSMGTSDGHELEGIQTLGKPVLAGWSASFFFVLAMWVDSSKTSKHRYSFVLFVLSHFQSDRQLWATGPDVLTCLDHDRCSKLFWAINSIRWPEWNGYEWLICFDLL